MGDITKNFSRDEFTCHCGCGSNNINPRLVLILQKVRDHFGMPLHIMSGVRCVKHNRKIGGAKNSQHLSGNAADVKIFGISPRSIANYANTLLKNSGGIKAYPSFTHIDVRAGFWRS